MRGNGVDGTVTSTPNRSSISAPCFSFTAAKPATRSSSCIAMTSSWLSIQLISASTLVNSVAWRLVKRRVGAERRPDLEDLAEAGGLRHLLEELRALRQVRGLSSKYAELEQLGLRLATALAISFGVWISMKPLSTQYCAQRVLEAWSARGR